MREINGVDIGGTHLIASQVANKYLRIYARNFFKRSYLTKVKTINILSLFVSLF